MGISKIDQESLLKKIQSDPNTAVAKQLLVPGSATDTVLRLSKKFPRLFTLEERLEISKETINALHYIAEHNYLAYLAITDRFDIIRKFFWEEEAFKQQIAYIQEIEKEKKEQEKQYMQNLIFSQEQLLSNKQQRDKISLEQRQNEEKIILNAGLYQYFREIEQQINERYYVKQIEVLTRAYAGREARMDIAIDVISHDVEIQPEDRIEFLNMRENYKQEFEAINQIPIYNQDNSINHQTLQRKYEELRNIDNKYKNLFSSKLEQYPNHPELRQLLQEEQNAVNSYEAKLLHNEFVRDQQLAEIKPHLDYVRREAKKDIKKVVGNVNDLLTNSNLEGLSINHQNLFKNTIKKLQEFESKLTSIDDHAEIKHLSQQFLNEISNINDIVKPPVMNSDIHQQLELEINTFKQLHKAFLEQASQSDVSFKVDKAQEEKTIEPSKNMAMYRTLAMKDKLKFFRTQDVENKMEAESPIDKVNRNKPLESEVNEELDEETREELENFLELLSSTADNMIENNNLKENEKQLTLQLKETCNEIFPVINHKIDKSKLEFFREALDLLKKNHPELKKVAKEMEAIIEKVDSSTIPKP